jgi:hypothetical protein
VYWRHTRNPPKGGFFVYDGRHDDNERKIVEQQGSIDRLVDLIIEHGIIVYPAAPALSADGWPAPMRIYIGIPQTKQATTANDVPLADEDNVPTGRIRRSW